MSIIDTAKTVYDLAKVGATIELQQELMKMREEALIVQEENLSLRQRVAELEQAFSIQKSIEFDGTVYWNIGQDGQKKGPYCQRCFEVDSNLVRLQDGTFHDGDRNVKLWCCKACKSNYAP